MGKPCITTATVLYKMKPVSNLRTGLSKDERIALELGYREAKMVRAQGFTFMSKDMALFDTDANSSA